MVTKTHRLKGFCRKWMSLSPSSRHRTASSGWPDTTITLISGSISLTTRIRATPSIPGLAISVIKRSIRSAPFVNRSRAIAPSRVSMTLVSNDLTLETSCRDFRSCERRDDHGLSNTAERCGSGAADAGEVVAVGSSDLLDDAEIAEPAKLP